jgi:hypothetical protein
MEIMRTIIAGSRSITGLRQVKEAVDKSEFIITEVISGGARGVDRLGEEYARQAGIDLVIFPANWTKNGKAAGHIRNERMAQYAIEDKGRPGGLIAVWDGMSRGTQSMIRYANDLGLKVFIFRVDTT